MQKSIKFFIRMKKIGIAYLLALLLFCFSQCAKQVEQVNQFNQGSMYPVLNNGKGITYQMTFYVGHSGKMCQGCIRMKDNTLTHLDCQGWGTECAASATVVLSGNSNYFTAVTTDTFGLTDQSLFNMPDRSLLTEDEKGQPVYLNIPAQLIYRDSTTLQFTLNGLYYSASAAYDND